MSRYFVVDSGTTTSRVRLLDEGKLIWSGTRQAGARDTAVDGHNGKLRAAVGELLQLARAELGGEPDAIICSGMITSNMGLFEVAHLPAPAGPDDLARGIVTRVFPDLDEVPLTFIPGVKTLPAELSLESLAAADVLRGEEVEIAGLRGRLDLEREAVFLHIGSHHKAIDVDGTGRITASRTAITGELLGAVMSNTILKSSVAPLADLELDLEAALAGARAAVLHGTGRALFLVRIGEQLGKYGPERMTSYLLGALAILDIPLLAPAGDSPDQHPPVVLYGSGAFPEILAAVLSQQGWTDVTLVEAETADQAAVEGAVMLYERSRVLGGVT